MKLNDQVYDVLKYIAIIALPAIEVAIEPLFAIWGWNYGPELAKTTNIIAVLLGSLLMMSNATYKKEDETKG